MTRKDYIEIAKILNDYTKNRRKAYDLDGFNATDQMIADFCAMLKVDNRHFDAQKFIDAVNKS